MRPLHPATEPNHVELVWAVRKVTPIQAKYIEMFYGHEALKALGGEDERSRQPAGRA
jgi:hypothetical protein